MCRPAERAAMHKQADPQTHVDPNVTLLGHADRSMCVRFWGCKKFRAVPGSI